jgi:hypothetical protein
MLAHHAGKTQAFRKVTLVWKFSHGDYFADTPGDGIRTPVGCGVTE